MTRDSQEKLNLSNEVQKYAGRTPDNAPLLMGTRQQSTARPRPHTSDQHKR